MGILTYRLELAEGHGPYRRAKTGKADIRHMLTEHNPPGIQMEKQKMPDWEIQKLEKWMADGWLFGWSTARLMSDYSRYDLDDTGFAVGIYEVEKEDQYTFEDGQRIFNFQKSKFITRIPHSILRRITEEREFV